ncbi:MAG TPA: hypothetical protein VFF39_16720, partial [Verrucomicrobiae bacterium]|nr:hypothetical protein [Verrucomicrobiae bacterium]
SSSLTISKGFAEFSISGEITATWREILSGLESPEGYYPFQRFARAHFSSKSEAVISSKPSS